MPRNDEGEFEMLVDNRQLMAVLFVLFIVCSLVFGIGYWIGKNSAPEPQPQVAAAKPSPGETGSSGKPEAAGAPAEVTAPLPQAAADVPLPPGEAKVTSPETTPVGGEKPQPPPEVKPAADVKPAVEAKPAVEVKPVAPPPKPVETPKPPKPAPRESARPVRAGTYLQVAAVKKADAEILVDALKKRGFSAIVAPVTPGQPADGLWRALVGPLADAAAIAKARADLQSAAFKNVFVQKY